MNLSREELEQDIREINLLLENASLTSPRLKNLLKQHKDGLTSNLKSLPKPTSEKEEEKVIVEEVKENSVNNEQKPNIKANGNLKYAPITSFSWDQDGYNGKNVFIYISMTGIAVAKDRVTCDFAKDSFDLKIRDFMGKNYRLLKTNLSKDIIPEKSKFRVKENRIVITLRKAEGKYGTDHWTDLVEKNKAMKNIGKDDKDPTAGIMDLMKQMYDEGDDQMRKTIGEAMLKSRQGMPMDPMETN